MTPIEILEAEMSLERCDSVAAVRWRELAIQLYDELKSTKDHMGQWLPIESVPMDGSPVLVWLPTPMLKSHVHSATFLPNIAVIGGVFAFDATCKPTHWMPKPKDPTV